MFEMQGFADQGETTFPRINWLLGVLDCSHGREPFIGKLTYWQLTPFTCLPASLDSYIQSSILLSKSPRGRHQTSGENPCKLEPFEIIQAKQF